MKEKVSKINLILIALFLIFVFGFGFAFLILPDKTFSENENRVLQTAPVLTLDSLADGEFTADFETYVNDQFPLRDAFVSLRTATELFLGKREINGVYVCTDHDALIEKFTLPDRALTDRQIHAINRFVSYQTVPVTVALIPNAVYVDAWKLPRFAVNDDQFAYCESVYAALENVQTVNLFQPLLENSYQGLYYRTDHHQTGMGAFVTYSAVMEQLGEKAEPIESFTKQEVATDFYGTLYSKGNFHVEPDTIVRWTHNTVTAELSNDDGAFGSLFNDDYLTQKDKYASFLNGNPGHAEIRTSAANGKTLVVLKDSYSHAIAPLLVAHYETIHLLDVRYLNRNISEIIRELDPDQILLLYNIQTFSAEESLTKIGVAPKTE